MKKLLAILGLAVGLSYATDTRVMTMGKVPDFLKNECILRYPTLITRVNKSLYKFELGDTTLALKYAAAFWTGGDAETGRQGIGLFLRKNVLFAPPPTFPQPSMGFGVVAGKSFGKFSVATSFYYSQEANKLETDTTYPGGMGNDTLNSLTTDDYNTSNTTFMFGMGLDYAEGCLAEMSVGYAMHDYSSEFDSSATTTYLDNTDSTDRVDQFYYHSVEQSDGANSIGFSMRVFHALGEKFTFIPFLTYTSNNYSTVIPYDSTYMHYFPGDTDISIVDPETINRENKGNKIGFGLGANIYPKEGATILFGFVGNLTSQDINYKYSHDSASVDSGYVDTLQNTSIKQLEFVTGAEVPVFSWFTLRGAMRKTILGQRVMETTYDFHNGKASDKVTTTSSLPEDLQLWIGLRLRIGSLIIDGNLDPMFLYRGPYIIGGQQDMGLLNVSAVYTF